MKGLFSRMLGLYLSITFQVLSTNSACQLCHLGGVLAGGEDQRGPCIFQHILHLPARLRGSVSARLHCRRQAAITETCILGRIMKR